MSSILNPSCLTYAEQCQIIIFYLCCNLCSFPYLIRGSDFPLLMFLGPRRIFGLVVSFWLWISPHGILRLPFGEPSLPEFKKSWLNHVCVSVAIAFLHGRVANPAQNPLDPVVFCRGFPSPSHNFQLFKSAGDSPFATVTQLLLKH